MQGIICRCDNDEKQDRSRGVGHRGRRRCHPGHDGRAGRSGGRRDSPAGFWYGTDSATVTITGHVPYQVPVIGGTYGGYIGMTGNWANLAGCRKIVVWSAANAAQANANYAAHYGVGTGVYWFMGGPGVDPRYNGTQAEASRWGAQQAARTLYDISHLHVTYPVVFMDIEIPGNAPNYTPAPDNGWNTVYTSACSGVVRTYHIPAAVDRADLNGFAAYLTSHSHYKAGVYSAPDIWAASSAPGPPRRYRTRTNGPTSPSPAAWPTTRPDGAWRAPRRARGSSAARPARRNTR